jgi:3-isopropylmalate/(R)-2-methylmalate dehydratase large subunit
MAKTLYDKLIDSHLVRSLDKDARQVLLYVDRTVLNEYTSPQAFTGLRQAHRPVWRPEAALGTVDHVNPTAARRTASMPDPGATRQAAYFAENCRDFGIELFDVLHPLQGIEHVVMPEIGLVLPGMVIAAGDSHTTTYGAFGALGFGIGTSDIEHYLATQTLIYKRLKTMRVTVNGTLGPGARSKDIIMALVKRVGASGATGYAIEFQGPAIRALSVEARMTICNMAVECGARGALVAPDEKVAAYLQGRARAPKGAMWDAAVAAWKLAITLAQADVTRIMQLAGQAETNTLTVDLQNQIIMGPGLDVGFEIDPIRKEALMQGLDAIGQTLELRDDIRAFQNNYFEANPWLR